MGFVSELENIANFLGSLDPLVMVVAVVGPCQSVYFESLAR